MMPWRPALVTLTANLLMVRRWGSGTCGRLVLPRPVVPISTSQGQSRLHANAGGLGMRGAPRLPGAITGLAGGPAELTDHFTDDEAREGKHQHNDHPGFVSRLPKRRHRDSRPENRLPKPYRARSAEEADGTKYEDREAESRYGPRRDTIEDVSTSRRVQ